MDLLRLGDVMAPSFGLGIFITRIGCFLNGCCFGKACGLPWAVTFPPTSPAGSVQQGLAIHPTQLYSSLYGLLITGLLIWLDRKPRFQGFVMSSFFVLYGTARFLVEFVRYSEPSVQAHMLGLNINQVIALGMILAGAVLFIVLPKRDVPKL